MPNRSKIVEPVQEVKYVLSKKIGRGRNVEVQEVAVRKSSSSPTKRKTANQSRNPSPTKKSKSNDFEVTGGQDFIEFGGDLEEYDLNTNRNTLVNLLMFYQY